jgi:hypothetical protein
MKALYTEILQRFPEVQSRISEGDEELPYLLMGYLADWLKELGDAVTPAITERVVAFARWCENQPRGKDAGDDLLTVFVVGFYEHLFGSASTRHLLPHLVSRADLTRNADYLRQWIGAENYERALQEYERGA